MRRAPVTAVAILVVLAVVPAAGAKFRISLALGASSPVVGQPLTVSLRTDVELPPEHELVLLAVAPGRTRHGAVAALTGGPSPRDGFAVSIARVRADRWRGVVRFPRRGVWTLVVPNWGAEGYAIPPPLVRTVVVR